MVFIFAQKSEFTPISVVCLLFGIGRRNPLSGIEIEMSLLHW